MIDVITTFYGSDPLRVSAFKECLGRWTKQTGVAITVVEMVFDGVSAISGIIDGVRHVKVEASASNKGIWQKEALLNIGIRSTDASIVVLIDSDVMGVYMDGWFERMAAKVAGTNTMIQGFSEVVDTVDPYYKFHSLRSMLDGEEVDVNPGLVWAMSRDLLERNGGLNPYCVYGSGDSMMVSEYLGGGNQLFNDWCFQFPRFSELRRSVAVAGSYEWLDEGLIHVNHGGGVGHHAHRHLMTRWFDKSILDCVELGGNGLVRWRGDVGQIREVVGRHREMRSWRDVDRICSEIYGKKIDNDGF